MGSLKVKRVVIDTNVLVSGILFGGSPGRLVNQWKGGEIRALCSREIMEEYLRVLAYPKFALTEPEIDFIVTQEILPWFEVVHVSPGKACVKADPFDDQFIWCALEGKADAIISGDEHLLRLRSSPILIVSVSEFLK